MLHHLLKPEATGTVGLAAEWMRDPTGKRTQTSPLRCELVGWLGDDLIEVHPDYIVSGALANALRTSALTGFELGEVVLTKSAEFVSYAGELPDRWERLIPTGDTGDDLSRQDGQLIVSDRALALLNDHRILEATLSPAGGTEEAARFVRQREEARAAEAVQQDSDREVQESAQDAEAGRVMALLAEANAGTSAAVTMRTNAGHQIAGDVPRAVSALGAAIEDDRVLAVLRLVDGPIEVDADGPTYYRGHRSVIVRVTRGVVTCVDFVLRPSRNSPDATYPRRSELVHGVEQYSREEVLQRLGEPKATKKGREAVADEYRIGRRRVLFYWDSGDLAPSRIVVGRRS